MAAQKGFILDAQDLYHLLVHYTDGECPLSGEVKEVLVNPYFERLIGFLVESPEWETEKALQLRYQGKRIASWKQGDGQMQFEERNETPKLQG